MAQYIIQEEARCLLTHYVTAKSKKEALSKFYADGVDSTEVDEILDTVEVFEKEIIKN